jgi:hypothetical protein
LLRRWGKQTRTFVAFLPPPTRPRAKLHSFLQFPWPTTIALDGRAIPSRLERRGSGRMWERATSDVTTPTFLAEVTIAAQMRRGPDVRSRLDLRQK